jgi:glycosyltransferase involved in cell wall biosynthesis
VLVAPFNTRLDVERRELYERFGMWCPVKLFEYLATGKPIVIPGLKEIKSYLNDNAYYYIGEDIIDLIRAIIIALRECGNPRPQTRRRNHSKSQVLISKSYNRNNIIYLNPKNC